MGDDIVDIGRRDLTVFKPPKCPQCGEVIRRKKDAVIVVDPYRRRADGFCKSCYEKEKVTVDLERRMNIHVHRWQFDLRYWWCVICDKKVMHEEGASKFMSSKPYIYLGQEKRMDLLKRMDKVEKLLRPMATLCNKSIM